MREMKLQDLKAKSPAELVSFAEELEVENASTMRKQELMFAILKQLSMRETDIIGEGVVEVLSDRTISMSRPPRFDDLGSGPATPSTDKSDRRRKANAILRSSKSTPSILRIPKKPAIKSISTT
jgi:hypothetical protein